MIAHAPYPRAASTMPVAAAAVVAMISRTSSARNAMSRCMSAIWVEATAPITNPSDRAANSGWTSGSP